MAQTSQRELALTLLRSRGILRSYDLTSAGIGRETIRRLANAGLIEQVERGVYRLASTEMSEHSMLAEVATRVPQGIICLLSALAFHQLTTQNPFEIWVTLAPTQRKPQLVKLPVKIVRFSGQSLTTFIETHQIDGVPVQIYSPAKTIADCFKFRNKLGIDVALEALHLAWRNRRVTMDELWKAAEVDRVAKVIRPYLESLEAIG